MASNETPLMRQYHEIKSRHQGSLLLFRMGDFYELFFDDALVAAKALDIALTSRNKNDPNPVPMCGVPHHAAPNYINRLVNQGYKVAICEQLEDPTAAKGIVKRDVIRVVSPGTRLDPESLDAKAPNYTHAAHTTATGAINWATCDFTTGKFWFGTASSVGDWLTYAGSQNIAEFLAPETDAGHVLLDAWRAQLSHVFAQSVPAFYFGDDYAAERLREQFSVATLTAVHPKLNELAGACGALVKYFQETQKAPRIASAVKVDFWGQDDSMELDPASIRALEILPLKTATARSRDISLLSWLDRTKTAMGSRLLRDWVLRPLTDRAQINARLDQVESLLSSHSQLHAPLNEIYDLERLLSRVSLGHGATATARDLLALSQSIAKSEDLAVKLAEINDPSSGMGQLRSLLGGALDSSLLSLAREVTNVLAEQPPASTREGGMFRKGFRADLDELIGLSENGEQWLANFEAAERKATGISSLKVRFNRVFGYYIEITKANLASAPSHYVRKQTMVGGERYITEELKSFEEKILTAEKKRCDLEYALFREYCGKIAELGAAVGRLARAVAQVDVLAAVAQVSYENEYVRPELDDSLDVEIIDGKHPTVAPVVERFVSNSVHLDEQRRFLLITGPNMGGKSTVMRQTALIALMAQMGSFVPATRARLGVVDRIFTRIGANDNTADGASTFMVEMSEMSFILRHATKHSLILIDEIGRGTSTYDGMSLAWALASDIVKRVQARTMFATHYHELTRLSEESTAVVNARVAVQLAEDSHDIRFLYKLEPGVAERSYGILVARLAGLPEDVLEAAQSMLMQLESGTGRPVPIAKNKNQLTLDLGAARSKPAPAQPSPIENWLKSLEINELTPVQALVQLAEWKKKVDSSRSKMQ